MLAFHQRFFRQNSLNKVLPKFNSVKVSGFTVEQPFGEFNSY